MSLVCGFRMSIATTQRNCYIDRSATGYLPAAEHERVADALFAHPDVSASGWETATGAQARIGGALDDVLSAAATDGDIAVIGHGAVGTLWWCHLSPTSRSIAVGTSRGRAT